MAGLRMTYEGLREEVDRANLDVGWRLGQKMRGIFAGSDADNCLEDETKRTLSEQSSGEPDPVELSSIGQWWELDKGLSC